MPQDITLLDEEAEKLFHELIADGGGIDKRSRILPPDHPVYQYVEKDDDERQDPWRLALIQLIYRIAAYLMAVRCSGEGRSGKDSFIQVVKSLNKLAQMPAQDGSILVRYRGIPTGTIIPAKADYIVLFGPVIADAASGIATFKRMGEQDGVFSDRMRKAFGVFSEYEINTFYMEIPDFESKQAANQMLDRIRTCMRIFACYHNALKTKEPVVFQKGKEKITLPVVRTMKGIPDINLTLTAGLNNLKPETTQSMIQKVDAWMQAESEKSGKKLLGIYNAVFDIKNLQEKLIKPPVEINNVKWMTFFQGEQEDIPEERIHVARLVLDSTPQKAGETLQAVYGDDYRRIDSSNLGSRIHLASMLLDSVEKKVSESPDMDIEKEVVGNIEGRFDQVRDEVFGDVTVQEDDVIKVRTGDKETRLGKIHPKLKGSFKHYKGRSVTRAKIKDMTLGAADFNQQDYEIIARDFNISTDDAKGLIALLKDCFGKDGRFLRNAFDRNIPEFAKYEEKVFDFLWHYLKETLHRNDRVAFLNSVQKLTSQMKQRKRGIRVLLTDIFSHTEEVNFSDRNAFMLASLLIRKYNKEGTVDIEVTPEEVLLVKEGLDQSVIITTRKMLNGVQRKIFKKVRAIHQKLEAALNARKKDKDVMPIRYLLFLEREAYIFFSLVGGSTAHAIIRSAVQEYGSPKSRIYSSKNISKHLPLIFQHLNVVMRAMGRVGNSDDLSLIDKVTWGEEEFIRLAKSAGQENKIRRMMKWVDVCRDNILKKSWKDTGDADGFKIM